MQVPDAHTEAKILLGQRAHRADVDRVERVSVVDLAPGVSVDHVMVAALEDREFEVCVTSSK